MESFNAQRKLDGEVRGRASSERSKVMGKVINKKSGRN